MHFGMLFGKFVWNGTTVTIELSRQSESLKKAQLVTREVQMASAFAHRLFTRGHVKYVRFHGDRAAERGRNEFHSRLSLAIRLDAFPPAPFLLVKTWGTGKSGRSEDSEGATRDLSMIYSTRANPDLNARQQPCVGVLYRSVQRWSTPIRIPGWGPELARLFSLALCHEARDPAIRVNMNRFMHLSAVKPHKSPSNSNENEQAIANETIEF
ncbi:hypothetical protein ALC62_12450 [Cyphomyrmex costatus]|uniref:Uncharacterized protein n=1 Tax=Cyphomyrmex costatus TaxID=456900 RepID=A0A151IB40_9HYME|nr:hypothetical protein ALC62_12450 [Cyphomyrmex costatus]